MALQNLNNVLKLPAPANTPCQRLHACAAALRLNARFRRLSRLGRLARVPGGGVSRGMACRGGEARTGGRGVEAREKVAAETRRCGDHHIHRRYIQIDTWSLQLGSHRRKACSSSRWCTAGL